MDLFEPTVPEELWHPNLHALMRTGVADGERKVLQQWADGFIDRDGKFVKEFQTTFNSSFWELYLHASFRELGFTCDFSHQAPDFLIRSQEGEICAEAVIANHADGYKPEWYRTLSDLEHPDLHMILHISTIRIANAIYSKYMKFKKSYALLPHVRGKPFIICVAPFEQPLFFIQNDHALRRVLYGYDQPLWIDSENCDDRIIVGEALLGEIIKDNGSPIPLGFFTRSEMPEVSAVIFSNTATYTKVRALSQTSTFPIIFVASRYNAKSTKPHLIVEDHSNYTESLLDGIHLCLNPFADVPIDVTRFSNREITLHRFETKNKQYIPYPPDEFLLQHSCSSFVQDEMCSGFELRNVDHPFKTPNLAEWSEGQLHPVDGTVYTFTDKHLSHYQRWTILVSRDIIDNDWIAQATIGHHRTLASYQQADKSQDFLSLYKSYTTKEEALSNLQQIIDERG